MTTIEALPEFLERVEGLDGSLINQAEEAARTNGTFLGDELLQRGLAEETLAVYLSFKHNVPMLDLRRLDPNTHGRLFLPTPEVRALIPSELARQRKVLPLTLLEETQGPVLTVAMRNPGDQDTLKQIQEAVDPSIRVRPVVAFMDLVLAIEAAYLPEAQE